MAGENEKGGDNSSATGIATGPGSSANKSKFEVSKETLDQIINISHLVETKVAALKFVILSRMMKNNSNPRGSITDSSGSNLKNAVGASSSDATTNQKSKSTNAAEAALGVDDRSNTDDGNNKNSPSNDSVKHKKMNSSTKVTNKYELLFQQKTLAFQNERDLATRKMLRTLKSSLMKKKNLFSVKNSSTALLTKNPPKIKSNIKHYFIEAPKAEWIKILSNLTNALLFPRAIIFCDDKKRTKMYEEMLITESNGNVATLNGSSFTSESQEAKNFAASKAQFLYTVSEPAVCQNVLPKVSCIFHLDVPHDLLSVYAVRLLPLDNAGKNTNTKDSVSVLFTEKAGKIVGELEKLFGISFMDMPFEFIPKGGF